MNTNINTNSWHYKLAFKNENFQWKHSHYAGGLAEPIDTCSYVRLVLWQLLKFAFAGIIAVGAVLSVLLFGATMIAKYYEYAPLLEFVKNNAIAEVLFMVGRSGITVLTAIVVIWITLVLVVQLAINLAKRVAHQCKKPDEDVEKPAGFFTVAKMKFKEKTCTRVTFVEK